MSADIIQFVPRSISQSDRRACLKGPTSQELAALEYSIVNQIFPSAEEMPRLHDFDGKPAFTFRGETTVLDTAPSEYVAPAKDPA